jgi:hypothetical protein
MSPLLLIGSRPSGAVPHHTGLAKMARMAKMVVFCLCMYTYLRKLER